MSKVLVVEDSPKQLKLFESILDGNELQVIGKSSGEQGINYIKENGPVNVIFSDFNLGGINGLEFFKASKTISPNSYRILVSGNHSLSSLDTHIKEEDIHYFLTKPFLFKEVVELTKTGLLHSSLKRF